MWFVVLINFNLMISKCQIIWLWFEDYIQFGPNYIQLYQTFFKHWCFDSFIILFTKRVYVRTVVHAGGRKVCLLICGVKYDNNEIKKIYVCAIAFKFKVQTDKTRQQLQSKKQVSAYSIYGIYILPSPTLVLYRCMVHFCCKLISYTNTN